LNNNFLKLGLLKGIITKTRNYELRDIAQKVLLIVSSLSIFDVLVAVLGASYLSGNIGTFLGKSGTAILSDFLFLEGVVILAIGILIAVARAWQETTPSSESTTGVADNVEQTPKKRISLGMLMVIIGAILIGLSITVGTLLL